MNCERHQRHLILIGFMATGKSTFGAELARQAKLQFIDLDKEIERVEGIPIVDIFAFKGEGYFRSLESNLLRLYVMNRSNSFVLATGGGAVLDANNRHVMSKHGFVVRTKATRAEIVRRLKNESQIRPLILGDLEEHVDKLLYERKHAYDFADLVIDTEQMDRSKVAEMVLSAWYKNKNQL